MEEILDESTNEHNLSRRLFKLILVEVIRLTSTAESRQSLPTSINEDEVFAWEATSSQQSQTWPMQRFCFYAESWSERTRLLYEHYGLPPLASFNLPGEDTEDGIPTERLYFLDRDGAINKFYNKLVMEEGDEEPNPQTITESKDIDSQERQELLGELLAISSIE